MISSRFFGLLCLTVKDEGVVTGVKLSSNTEVGTEFIMLFDRPWTFDSRENTFPLKDEKKLQHTNIGLELKFIANLRRP